MASPMRRPVLQPEDILLHTILHLNRGVLVQEWRAALVKGVHTAVLLVRVKSGLVWQPMKRVDRRGG